MEIVIELSQPLFNRLDQRNILQLWKRHFWNMDPSLGTIVTIPQGHVSLAQPLFAIGKWVSIELCEPHGKNYGSINRIHYFTCKMNYGAFIQQS